MKLSKAITTAALAVLSALILFTGQLTALAAQDKVVAEKTAGSLIPGLNAYNSKAQGTIATGSVDEYENILEIHTVDTAERALCGNGYSLKSKIYSGALRPGMRLEVMYKYVPDTTVSEADTPTDVAKLLLLKPQLIVTSPNLNNGSNSGTIDARDNIVANEWATAVFDIGDYVAYSNTSALDAARTMLLSKNGSGAASGTPLAIEGGIAVHVDPKDTLYVGTVKLIQSRYDITLELCGGNVDGNEENASAVFEGEILSLPTPVRDGYTFLGWAESADASEALVLSTYVPKSDTTLYALYAENEKVIEVSFDLVGGNIGGDTTAEPSITNGKTLPDYPENPEKQYRFFKGWTTVKDDKSTLVNPETYIPEQNVTLYAYYDNVKVLAENPFDKFATGLNKYNDAAQGTYTSGLVIDGRSNVAEYHTVNSAQRVLSCNGYDVKSFSQIPLKPGMKLEIDYKYIPDTAVAEADTPTDLDAIKTQKPGMIVSAPSLNSGKVIEASDTVVVGEWATAVFDIGSYVSFDNNDYIKTARVFLLGVNASGAPTGTALQIEGGTSIHVDPKDTIYAANARYTVDCYLISLDLNGGSVDGNTSVDPIFYEGEDVVFPTPEREGSKLVGWGYNPTDISGINTESYVPTRDVTLYALWSDGNIGTQSAQSAKHFVKGIIGDISGNPVGVREELSIDGYDGVVLYASENTTAAFTPDCWSLNTSFENSDISSRTKFVVTYKYVPAENTDSELDKILATKPAVRFGTAKGWTEWLYAANTVVRDNWATMVFDIGNAKNADTGAVMIGDGDPVTATHAQLRALGINVSGAPSGTPLDYGAGNAIHLDADDRLYIGDGKFMYKYDYEILFDANGGGGGDTYEHIIKDLGGAKFDGAKPIRMGYDFVGWAISADATRDEVVAAGFMPTGDITLYAVWEKNDNYVLADRAVVYPLSGDRRTVEAGAKIFSDLDAVFADTVPSYLVGTKYVYGAAEKKTVRYIEDGRIYVLTPSEGSGSDAASLVKLGFDKIGSIAEGELSASLTEVYDVYSGAFTGTDRFDLSIGASSILIADIVMPDDSLLPPEIILNPADKLDEHPEYAEFLEGARKFGGCPSITQTPDGTLWLSITAGGTGEDMYNYAALKKSTDGGNTWSEIVLVADPATPVRTSEPFVWCDPDGRLWFWWSQMFIYATGENTDSRMGVFSMYSDDYGASWSQPVRQMHGFSNQPPIVLKNGSWAMPINIWNNITNYHPEHSSLFRPSLYLSTDKGASWTLAGTAQDCSRSLFWENSVMEKDDGTLEMYYRTLSDGVEKTVSTDGGKTWSKGESAGISMTSARTATIELESGEWLFISHDDEYANGARSHLTVWLSEDEGATKPYKLLLDTVGWYPAVYEGNDGYLYIVYDRGREGGGCAMLAKITVDDIKAGKLVSEGSMLKYLTFRGTIATDVLPEVKVSFDVDGGKEIEPMRFRTNHNEFTKPVTERTLPTAEKDNSVFLGWATEKGGEAVYAANDVYTPASLEAVTLFAVFEAVEAPKETVIRVKTLREDGSKPSSESLARVSVKKNGEDVLSLIESADTDSSVIELTAQLYDGEYEVTVEKNGYLTASATLTVSDGEGEPLYIELIPGDIKGNYSDICGDGKVDVEDFVRVLRGFNTAADTRLKAAVDINEDGKINVTDLAAVKQGFGKTAG